LGPLFLNGYTNEVLALSELWDSGFTPKVIDVIQVDGLYSMIQMQRISGDSCSKAILDPSCNKILLLNDIRILYDFLRHHSICHNDFTLENIICTPEGKVYLIDFENSSVGSSNCTDYLNLSLIYSDLN
jgi:tRNA A-37 threonylcarbamoyl transferase component Bud32